MKVTVFSVALALVAAAGAHPVAQAADSEGIVIYNAQHASLGRAWVEAFVKDTGITVSVRNGSDTELANQLVQEGVNSPADVFLTENSPGMALVDKAGLLAPLNESVLEQVPENFRSVTGNWTGIAARATVFAYDKRKLKSEQLPKSLLDLAGADWKQRWAASPAGADFQAIVGALLQLKGERTTAAWLDGLQHNAVKYRGNTAAMKAVNGGQIDGAVIYHYYYYGDQSRTGENSDNVALHYFRHQDPGAFVSVSGGAVLASGKHQEQAQEFLEWLTGPAGQAILRDGDSFEYAVGLDEESNGALVPLADLQAPDVNASTLDSKKVNALMIEAGIL